MVQWLSKNSVAAVAMMVVFSAGAQSEPAALGSKDYKDPKTHERFRNRRVAVANWQINQLKEGALVVRLGTSRHLIDGLKKQGLDVQAEKARLEQAAINKNYIRAFLDKYDFSKVYFIYSSSSDSLLNGARSGIFVDSTLKVNPSIVMKEKFYVIAEPDYIYNSSIGFVREDSARAIAERGNPSASEAPIVVKNKYGHQLKDPFPFSQTRHVFPRASQVVYVRIGDEKIPYNVAGLFSDVGGPVAPDSRSPYPTHTINGQRVELTIPRRYTYDVLSQVVHNFNTDLIEFYRRSPQREDVDMEDARPFFY